MLENTFFRFFEIEIWNLQPTDKVVFYCCINGLEALQKPQTLGVDQDGRKI